MCGHEHSYDQTKASRLPQVEKFSDMQERANDH